MSTLRFRDRHLHKTVFETIKAGLESRGWSGPVVPLGTDPVTFEEFLPEDNTKVVVAPNTIVISAGDPGRRTPSEIGDGLFNYQIPFFVDVYGKKRGIAESICSDVMDILRTYRDTSQIQDWTNPSSPEDSDDTWYIDDEQGPIQPAASMEAVDFRKYWRLCRFMVIVEYLQ